MGYHDPPTALASRPPLTTVRMPSRAQGRIAVERLIEIIDGRPDFAGEVVADAPEFVMRGELDLPELRESRDSPVAAGWFLPAGASCIRHTPAGTNHPAATGGSQVRAPTSVSPPVVAMPWMKLFWAEKNTITTGMMKRVEPAMRSAHWLPFFAMNCWRP